MGFNINIEDPCHEDWDKMQIGILNRHCQQCDKDVHDFTGMSRSEILEFILINKGKSVCGRFRKEQLDYTLEEINDSMNAILSRTIQPFQKELLLTTAAVLMASCSQNGSSDNKSYEKTNKEVHTTAVVNNKTSEKADQIREESHRINKVTARKPNKSSRIHQIEPETAVYKHTMDTIKITYPEIKIRTEKYKEIIMGALPFHNYYNEVHFKYGMDSFQRYVSEKLTAEIKQLDSGKVLGISVRFKITRWGRVRDVSIIDPNEANADLEKKVKKAVRRSKGWVPYRNRDKKRISTYMTTTIFLKND